MKFAMFGTGFWARYQLAGWRELPGAECVALYNRTISKAQLLAREFEISAIYNNPEELLHKEKLDFVDVVTDVDHHEVFVKMAADHKIAVVCQKPIASTLPQAEAMVEACRSAGVPLLINENWRWQAPLRELKRILAAEEIGTPFRARLDMISGFPVFRNQPFLRELDRFILMDLGSHILDVARFLFGEAKSLYCQTHKVHSDIKGEDVATVMLRMGNKTTVLAEMAYAENPLERECFPETLVFVEGDKGSLELAKDYWIRVTTANGTTAKRFPPPFYSWVNPAYEVVHSSIVACQANLLQGLNGGLAETTGEDNLRTMRLVFASYESATNSKAVCF
ncbi:MAG TPA: Gfo/Idh/MocA family oxidoreductase [Candidatus Sulfotelmatobacter sp.]|nr:Gfo/Idh/MocA family oxidoreductase [Candidatus Sulfotelmatobacter sp.]